MNSPLKISLLSCTLLIFSFQGMTQENLVPNPSFENYSLCPDNWAQSDRITNWVAYKGTPDYFNSCELTNSFSTPLNFMGNQSPIFGNAYAGLIFYSHDGINADEIIGVQLSQQLGVGVRYYISFKVVLKYDNPFGVCCANNKIGAKFSLQPYSASNQLAINNISHVCTDSIISDTLNWTTIFGAFTADSAYNYLMIGNFYSNPNININEFIPANDYSYYFVDDVCVSTDSTFAANYSYLGMDEEQLNSNFDINPNPVTDYIQVNQIFAAPYEITIYDIYGRILHRERNITSSYKIVNAAEFAKGILVINLKSGNQSINYKLLKL